MKQLTPLIQASGLAFLDGGQVAEFSATETLDHVDGKGTYRGYEILTFEDGSTIVSLFDFHGTYTLSPD